MQDNKNRNTNIHGTNKPPKKKKSATSKVIVTIFLVLLILALIFGAVAAIVVGYTPSVDDNPSFETDPNNNGDFTVTGEGEDHPQVSSGKYTRRDGVYNFLFVGKDRVAENTDVMMIISFDTNENDLSVMQIPRDTYIEYDGHGRRVNALYASLHAQAVNDGEENSVGAALEELSSILEKNLCIEIDYHFLIDLDGFADIVNAIGGVEIDIPYDLKYVDKDQDLYIDIKEGHHILNGEEAEQFVRFRADFVEGDVGRVEAQKIFLAAFLRQVKNSFNLKTIVTLANTVFDCVIDTDISMADFVYFAKEVIGVDLENAVFVTLPGCSARANVDSGAWYYIMARADALNTINEYINVYEREITDSIFDRSRVFTTGSEHINQIYEAEAGKYAKESYTAEGINKTPPKIDLVK